LNAEKSVEAAEECGAKGVGYVIIVAGGFGETGEHGKNLENRLKKIPEKYNTRILGPNSLGIFFPEKKIDTIFVEHGDKALAGGGGIAFITQSGSVGVESLGIASNTGFGLRSFAGIGNKADLDELDFLKYFGKDSKTDCIALYVESIEKGREFLEEAEEIARTKPVVVLKAGRTASGASAVSSHTGRLAGSDKVVSGALRQYGIQRAYDDEELCDAAKVLAMVKPAAGGRVAVITPAGGFGVMCTDYIESRSHRCSLRMARLSDKTREKIRKNSFPFASCSNPVDLTASADNAMYLSAIDALIDDEGVDCILCITFFAPPSISRNLIDGIAEKTAESPKPILVFTQYGPFTDEYLKEFYEKGVIGFPTVSRLVRAARFIAERGCILKSQPADTKVRHSKTHKFTDLFRKWQKSLKSPGSPDEWETRNLLFQLGLPVQKGIYIRSEKIELPLDITPPYAVKLCTPKVLHKTDVGGVCLGVSEEDLPSAVKKMRTRFPGEGIIITSMVRIEGPEIILGSLFDPVFGTSIMAGAGGILTEVYKDVAFRLAPCSKSEAREMLSELTVSPILQGYRGSTMDMDSLAEITAGLSVVSAAVCEGGNQLDINPIVWTGQEWQILDAKIVFSSGAENMVHS